MARRKTKMDYETIEPQTWKPENDGDQVEGRLVRKEENVGVNNSNLYHIDHNGTQTAVWGSTVLDNRLAFVEIGTHIRITYKGTNKNKKGQDVKIFKVERQTK